ncbi:MAG: methyltransferase domain-containing protein [Magnetospirillum gryphiswaldense]|nr:methyltransferase domain-containing protein [Magnetospirillum gryphiswaldense]
MNRKQQVQAAFSAATRSYEAAARAQAISAGFLADLVAARPHPAAPKVLEFGCGTGLLTRRLFPVVAGDWLVSDLSSAMLEVAQSALPGPRYRVMDAENPDLDERFDLIVSNLAAQWFADLPAAAARLAGLLNPGGHLVFSTLGADSFRQWRSTHQSLGLDCGVPVFPTVDALKDAMPQAQIVEQVFDLEYADGRAFAAELKHIGAGTPAPGHIPLSAGQMRRVFQALGSPCAMTYHVVHLIISKE